MATMWSVRFAEDASVPFYHTDMENQEKMLYVPGVYRWNDIG
jgi:hypothetical protein